jgi:hypothetical protein
VSASAVHVWQEHLGSKAPPADLCPLGTKLTPLQTGMPRYSAPSVPCLSLLLMMFGVMWQACLSLLPWGGPLP